MRLFITLILTTLLTSCAMNTTGLTKEQIAARESARDARYRLYGQVLTGLAVGAARGFAK